MRQPHTAAVLAHIEGRKGGMEILRSTARGEVLAVKAEHPEEARR